MPNVDDLGLIEKSPIDKNQKPRGETNEQSQRPVATDKSVKSDRGSFKDKC